MICNKCGKEVAEGSLFCEGCGTKLEPVATEVARSEVDAHATAVDEVTPPEEAAAKPEEVVTAESEEAVAESEEVVTAKPEKAIAAEPEEAIKAEPEEAITVEPEEAIKAELEEPAAPSEEPAAPSEEPAASSDEPATPEQEEILFAETDTTDLPASDAPIPETDATAEEVPEESDAELAEKTALRSELENLTEYEPITKKNKKKKIIIISAGVVAVIAIIAVAAFGIMNSGKRYLYGVAAKTVLHYSVEADKFYSSNKVLTDMNAIMEKSYTQKITNGGLRISINDDKENKQMSSDVSIAGLPLVFNLYLTDTRLVVGSPMLTFLEASPLSLGEDLASFANNNGFAELGAEITTMLEPYDFSYSKVSVGNILKSEPDREGLKQRYTTVLMNMIDKADYEKVSAEVPIGEGIKKGSVLKLTLNREQLLDWLKNDVEPTVAADTDLRDYLNSTSGVSGRTELGENPYDALVSQISRSINYLENESGECTLNIDLSVYKGIISGVTVLFVEEDEQKINFNLYANGEANRLDRLGFYFETEDKDSVTITAKGNHIGNPVITSDVVLSYRMPEQPSTTATLSFKWDTGLDTDNVTLHSVDIYGEQNDYTANFTTEGDVVKLLTTINGEAASWEVTSLQDSPIIPENTMLIKDVTIDDILDSMGATGDLIRNYLLYGGIGLQ